MQTKLAKKTTTRQGSTYIAVTGTALLVSLIGLAAMQLARLELRKATALNNQAYARQLAQSGVEMALAKIANAPNSWRSDHTHNVEVVMTPDGMGEAICYRFLDHEADGTNDGDLSDDDSDLVEIQGIGKVIDRTITNAEVIEKTTATFVYSVIYAPKIKLGDYVGPNLMSAFDVSGGNEGEQDIAIDSWSGQYFMPDSTALPPEAIAWSITRAEVYAKRDGSSNAKLLFKLYKADGNGLPESELDASSLNSEELPTVMNWVGVNFANATGLSVGTGFCLGIQVEHATDKVIVQYEGGGVVQANSQLLSASGGSWSGGGTDKSLWYRVHGVYVTETGEEKEFALSPGTWKAIPAN